MKRRKTPPQVKSVVDFHGFLPPSRRQFLDETNASSSSRFFRAGKRKGWILWLQRVLMALFSFWFFMDLCLTYSVWPFHETSPRDLSYLVSDDYSGASYPPWVHDMVHASQGKDNMTNGVHKSNVTTSSYGIKDRYFIVANLHNSQDILPVWKAELLRLINRLGVDNVYVSIYESFSRDGTKQILRDFSKTLNTLSIAHTLVAPNDEHLPRPRFKSVSDERIAFLSDMRNAAMKPFHAHVKEHALWFASQDPSMYHRTHGHGDDDGDVFYGPKHSIPHPQRAFTRLIFLNDIIFTSYDAMTLLGTLNGDYDGVCAMDMAPSGFYDRWVSRDVNGGIMSLHYPFSLHERSQALIQEGKPFPAYSCWNGMAIFAAKGWYALTDRRFSKPDKMFDSGSVMDVLQHHAERMQLDGTSETLPDGRKAVAIVPDAVLSVPMGVTLHQPTHDVALRYATALVWDGTDAPEPPHIHITNISPPFWDATHERSNVTATTPKTTDLKQLRTDLAQLEPAIQFRMRDKDATCLSSECFLVFQDLHDIGYHRFFMHPSVIVAYDLGTYMQWRELFLWRRVSNWILPFFMGSLERDGLLESSPHYYTKGGFQCIVWPQHDEDAHNTATS